MRLHYALKKLSIVAILSASAMGTAYADTELKLNCPMADAVTSFANNPVLDPDGNMYLVDPATNFKWLVDAQPIKGRTAVFKSVFIPVKNQPTQKQIDCAYGLTPPLDMGNLHLKTQDPGPFKAVEPTAPQWKNSSNCAATNATDCMFERDN